MELMDQTQVCRQCQANLTGREIPMEHRHFYGNKTHFSRLIGLEYPDRYDGVSVWMCPDCGYKQNRFTTVEL